MKRFIHLVILTVLGAASIPAQEVVSISYHAPAWSPDWKYLSFTVFENRNTQPRTFKADAYVVQVQQDKAYLQKVKRLPQLVQEQVRAANAEGLDLERTRKKVDLQSSLTNLLGATR